MRFAVALLVLNACAADPTVQKRPPLGGPLFPPAASPVPPQRTKVAPTFVSTDFTSTQDARVRPAHPDLLATCAKDTNAGKELCLALTGSDDWNCIDACLLAYADAHPPPRQPSPEPARLRPAPPAPELAPHDDPFAFALHDCIARVRDSGGSDPPVCHFDRPLDEMTFGQTHCDAKCAMLTEPYREPSH
jgi:hypothetical protein